MGDGPPAPAQPWTTQPRRAPAAVSVRSRPHPSEILGRAGERGNQAGRRALGPGRSQPRPLASLTQAPPAGSSRLPSAPLARSRSAPGKAPYPRPPPAGAGRALTYRQRTQVPGLEAQPKLPGSRSPPQPAVPAGEAVLERERRGLAPGPARRPRSPAQRPPPRFSLVPREGGGGVAQLPAARAGEREAHRWPDTFPVEHRGGEAAKEAEAAVPRTLFQSGVRATRRLRGGLPRAGRQPSHGGGR